jgi:hypothetical protein
VNIKPSEHKIVEVAKIFGREGSNISTYQKAINEASVKIALEDPGILTHRGTVFYLDVPNPTDKLTENIDLLHVKRLSHFTQHKILLFKYYTTRNIEEAKLGC